MHVLTHVQLGSGGLGLFTGSEASEALADLRGLAGGRVRSDPVPGRKKPLAPILLAGRLLMRHGRPARLAIRLLVVVAAGALPVAGAGWQPASQLSRAR